MDSTASERRLTVVVGEGLRARLDGQSAERPRLILAAPIGKKGSLPALGMSDGGRPTLDEHKEKVAWNPAYALVMMGEPERRISTAHSSSLLLIPLCVRARTKKGDGERSSYTLFERFFAPRCASHLSHLDRAGKSTDERPLNDVCSMWWDIAPVCGCSQGLDRAELDAACLDVMRMTLDLNSDACWESALHGLWHCYFEYPTQVKAIIDRFLDHHPDLRAELRAYAWAARAGRV